jgi:hypothetical protein
LPSLPLFLLAFFFVSPPSHLFFFLFLSLYSSLLIISGRERAVHGIGLLRHLGRRRCGLGSSGEDWRAAARPWVLGSRRWQR